MRYNRSLDLLAAAGVFTRSGKIESAAKAFTAAVKDPSFIAALKIIEASNLAAHKAAVKAGKIKANDQGIDSENPGEEFRIDVEENGDRVVQEAKALRQRAKKLLQRADAMCEDDLGFEASADDADLSFLDSKDTTAETDPDGDLDEDEIDDEESEEMDGPETASFIKAFGARIKSSAPSKAAPASKSAPSKTTASSFSRAVRNLNSLKS